MSKCILLLFAGLIFYGCTQNSSVSSGQKNSSTGTDSKSARRAEVLFLGHTSKHHDSGKYAPWLSIKLFHSGINMTYTVDLKDINTENLKKYDGLII